MIVHVWCYETFHICIAPSNLALKFSCCCGSCFVLFQTMEREEKTLKLTFSSIKRRTIDCQKVPFCDHKSQYTNEFLNNGMQCKYVWFTTKVPTIMRRRWERETGHQFQWNDILQSFFNENQQINKQMK